MCTARICIPIVAWNLAVQVGAAPLADGHVLRARVHILVVVLQRLHPVGVRVERRAAAQPLGHVLDRARRCRAAEQRLDGLVAHLVPAHVEHLEWLGAPRERGRQLVRVLVAPAVAKDAKVLKLARGRGEGVTQSLNGHRRVLAPPLPVDAAPVRMHACVSECVHACMHVQVHVRPLPADAAQLVLA